MHDNGDVAFSAAEGAERRVVDIVPDIADSINYACWQNSIPFLRSLKVRNGTDQNLDKPHWGARKIRELLVRKLRGDVRLPARSTVHAVLDRHGLVAQARKRPGASKAEGTPLSAGLLPNELWCADFKGEFKTSNGHYCYPLTVTDHASRFLLICEALESTKERPVMETFAGLFRQRGLPLAMRTDNACRSPRQTGFTISPSCPSGGSGWGSPSSASSQAIRSRMAAMNACI